MLVLLPFGVALTFPAASQAQTVSLAAIQSTVPASGLAFPRGAAVDQAGNVFIADAGNNRVLEVPAGGGVQTTVGSGLNFPSGVAVDGAGNVFIADTFNSRVVKVQAGDGVQTTVASGLNSPLVWRWMERAMSSSRKPTTTTWWRCN